MEQITKNADTFLHVLETANSSRVSSWQTDNLNKALSWADHHQRVYQSYKAREKIRTVLDLEFKKLAYRNCILVNAFGFEFMRDCKDFLVHVLRSNSSLGLDLLNSLPPSKSQTESTLIFNSLIHINKTLHRDDTYVSYVIDAICDTVDEAVQFQGKCPVVTTAPQRAITTLLTRVYSLNTSHDLLLKCFVQGKSTVRQAMVEWVERFGFDLWSESDVKLLTKCSALHPGFCKLHILYIVKLFGMSYGYKHQHLNLISDVHHSSCKRNSTEDLKSHVNTALKTAKDLIFSSSTDNC